MKSYLIGAITSTILFIAAYPIVAQRNIATESASRSEGELTAKYKQESNSESDSDSNTEIDTEIYKNRVNENSNLKLAQGRLEKTPAFGEDIETIDSDKSLVNSCSEYYGNISSGACGEAADDAMASPPASLGPAGGGCACEVAGCPWTTEQTGFIQFLTDIIWPWNFY